LSWCDILAIDANDRVACEPKPQASTEQDLKKMQKMIAVLAALTAFSVAPAAADVMNAKDLRKEIVGKRIYLATPLGGELPLFYARGGRVDGSGQAIGLGRFLAPTDKGRWWIQGNSLCQKWEEWYDGKTQCFVITRAGGNNIKWKRNDGLSGTARIGK
jgi:hypothetical protein